jgi:hypothetical protein
MQKILGPPDRVVILERGAIVHDAARAEVRDDSAMLERYRGVTGSRDGPGDVHRHCERKQSNPECLQDRLDCFAACAALRKRFALSQAMMESMTTALWE